MSLVGKKAPDFRAQAVLGDSVKEVGLADYKGKWLVLFFYTKSGTGVCDTEVPAFNSVYGQLKELRAEALAISCNSLEEQKAYAARFNLQMPLVSDATKAFTAAYGALNEANGLPWRATFIIDPDGAVQSEYIHYFKIGRSVEEALRMLSALQTGGACPVNWKPGTPRL